MNVTNWKTNPIFYNLKFNDETQFFIMKNIFNSFIVEDDKYIIRRGKDDHDFIYIRKA